MPANILESMIGCAILFATFFGGYLVGSHCGLRDRKMDFRKWLKHYGCYICRENLKDQMMKLTEDEGDDDDDACQFA